ncbi:relaxase/mobilization nuclease domain-containing protein, partial [Ruminococcus bicirculans (ex Wegman et al. 2014)]|uniref:relaxase/mobilization nuclease domain-containing protein n=1 Tax=Ruminococcus bicirculans (ex Wegman et al. 2014) TaxID=1160721 RepID=UPI00366C7F39
MALLKYVTGETKKHKAEIVTGINCSEDPESAYIEMGLCYEHYAGEKFHRTAKPVGKEHIKMHHYVISFEGDEVTPQEAQRIAEQWAYDTFGNNRQILIAVHTDTDNIHVHVAVNSFSMDGKRWIDNKSTLKKCRENINKLCKAKHLSVIEHPKWNANQNYAEWLARQNGTSWKQKLCDDIDRIVLMENVRSIDDLVEQLCNCGYLVRQGKYLSVRTA